jgi:uncharacterized protein (DUF2141 family)
MKFRFLFILTGLVLVLLLDSCARRGRPTGGEKDSTAPLLITAQPDHLTTNFKDKKIRLNFDEYIKLKDVNKQLVISPPMKHKPIITPVGTASKFISIKILDTLKENTTYTFNFGNSIEDNNENIPLKRFKYVISTGDYIDSLKVVGKIKDAFKNTVDENISVLLYEVTEEFNDSIIYNQRPDYITNTLDSIVYEISNVKAGKYLMVAIDDKNSNYQFEPQQEKIAFLEDFITLPTYNTYDFNLFKEDPEFKFTRPSQVKKGHIYFGYQGNGENIKIDLLSDTPKDFKSEIIIEKELDSISYWYSPIEKDSLEFEISNLDFKEKVVVKLPSKEIDSLLISSPVRGVISLRNPFSIESNIPIAKIDKTKIIFIDNDSTNVNFSSEITNSKLSLNFNFEKEYNNKYDVTLLPSAIEDLFGNVNDTLKYSFTTKHPEDYGIINLSLESIQNYPIIVELTDDKPKLIESVYVTEKRTVKFENLSPNNYQVRIIYDTNKNKKWDTGSYLKKVKPEKTEYHFELFEVRANWALNENFTLK